MPWIIVKFAGSEEVEAVPSCWYNQQRKTLLYPPFPRNRMEKAIKNEIEPGVDWKEYCVTLMRDKMYENFRLACGKASKCCLTSEVSETEILSEKRISRKKFSSSEEDSGSDLEIPKPQTIKKRLAHQQQTTTDTTTNMIISSHKFISEKDMDEVEKTDEALDDTKFKRTCINMMVKSMKLLRECESKIDELSDKIVEVSVVLKNDNRLPRRLPTENDNHPELDLFNDFPIKDDGMLENVELKLANGETFKKLLNNLIMIGGRDYKDCSRRFLQRILDDKFACGYSMQGHKKKKVFRSTKICACLLDAIQHCCKVSLKDIEVVVSTYLAKSPERLRRKGVSNPEPFENILQEVITQEVENSQAVENI